MWGLSFSLRGLVPCGLRSVIRALFLLLLASFMSPAGAVDYYYSDPGNGSVWGPKNSPYEACVIIVPNVRAGWSARTGGYYEKQGGQCLGKNNLDPNVTGFVGSYSYQYCPPEKPHFKWAPGASCVAELPPDGCPNSSKGRNTWKDGLNLPSPVTTGGCVASCEVKMTELHGCFTLPGGNESTNAFCEYSYLTTGQPCGIGDKQPSPSDPGVGTRLPSNMTPAKGSSSGCPAGSVQGGVAADGVPICMGTGSNPNNPKPAPPKIESEKTEAMPDGGTKTTKTETITNSDGSTTTNTTVTITKPDGTKSTSGGTVTSSTPGGLAGKADTPEKDQSDLCKQNPMLTICRNSSVSGSCGEITCQGDAIQCATLRAAAAMQCMQQKDEEALKGSPLTSKGQAAIDGTDLGGLPGPGKGQVVNIGTGMQGADGWLGAGSPFDDVSFTVQGHQVIVPLSKWSGYLESLRYVMMIIASLVSFRILGTAILKE